MKYKLYKTDVFTERAYISKNSEWQSFSFSEKYITIYIGNNLFAFFDTVDAVDVYFVKKNL